MGDSKKDFEPKKCTFLESGFSKNEMMDKHLINSKAKNQKISFLNKKLQDRYQPIKLKKSGRVTEKVSRGNSKRSSIKQFIQCSSLANRSFNNPNNQNSSFISHKEQYLKKSLGILGVTPNSKNKFGDLMLCGDSCAKNAGKANFHKVKKKVEYTKNNTRNFNLMRTTEKVGKGYKFELSSLIESYLRSFNHKNQEAKSKILQSKAIKLDNNKQLQSKDNNKELIGVNHRMNNYMVNVSSTTNNTSLHAVKHNDDDDLNDKKEDSSDDCDTVVENDCDNNYSLIFRTILNSP